MILKISKNAQEEINESKEYYNLQLDGLGEKFKNDVKHKIQSIEKFPNLYPYVSDKIQRTVLHRFPYSIFYSCIDDTIIILSVAHQHRKPKF